ncbi:hypothetical protein TNCV_4792401, partial [Trichonephila clavipes]
IIGTRCRRCRVTSLSPDNIEDPPCKEADTHKIYVVKLVRRGKFGEKNNSEKKKVGLLGQ